MKPKILILVESLKVGGGSERFAATLGTKLYEKGYNISYLTLMEEDPKYQFKGSYYTLNEGYIYTNVFKRSFDLFRYASKISRICRDLDIDTIISVSEVANFHAVLSRWLYGNKVKIIISQHINPEIFLESRLKTNLIKFFYPRADKTVCVSLEIERILNVKYGVKNTQTIYNMMNIQENIDSSQKMIQEKFNKLFENKANFNFINLGRLARQKGQWFLIRSFKEVVNQHPQANLFILGEGVLREELEELIAELELENNVHLLGEQENIFPFLKESDCFVMSSLWEGLPLVLIEALSVNLSIISTDCKTGPREILCSKLELGEEITYPYHCKFGVLSQPFDNELIFKTVKDKPLNDAELILKDLMIKFIEDPSMKSEYGDVNIRSGNFSEEKITKQWENLLDKINIK